LSAARSGRFEVLGISIDEVTPASAIEQVRSLRAAEHSGYVVFCTVSSVLSAHDDPQVRAALDEASLVTPDGMPLVWLGNRANENSVERVYGPDFMVDLFTATGAEFSHYFYGGRDGVGAELVESLGRRFPDLRIAGYREPADDLSVGGSGDTDLERISEAAPDIVWVGLGHPKQELWMQRHKERLAPSVLLGVGAAFDFHANRKKEAPEWMKRNGLQWLHRLIKEPRRLWRRYILGNTRFLLLLARERLRGLR